MKQWTSPPPTAIDPKKKYRARMQTATGAITVELYPQHAPKTVNNFISLAREGFYDGVTAVDRGRIPAFRVLLSFQRPRQLSVGVGPHASAPDPQVHVSLDSLEKLR